jgi:hypothetical protein
VVTKSKKKMVWKERQHISLRDLEGPLWKAITELTVIHEKYPNARLEVREDYDDISYLSLEEEREETDSEYTNRITQEANQEKARVARDLYQLAQLQARYGNRK